MTRTTLLIAAILVAGTASADARVALKDDRTIENGLVTVAIGKVLYKTCPDITPRRIKAFSFAMSLQSRAKSLGYSDAEIDAYLDSERDKDRVKAKATSYLKSKGAKMESRASICAVGRNEIATGSPVGKFLRAN